MGIFGKKKEKEQLAIEAVEDNWVIDDDFIDGDYRSGDATAYNKFVDDTARDLVDAYYNTYQVELDSYDMKVIDYVLNAIDSGGYYDQTTDDAIYYRINHNPFLVEFLAGYEVTSDFMNRYFSETDASYEKVLFLIDPVRVILDRYHDATGNSISDNIVIGDLEIVMRDVVEAYRTNRSHPKKTDEHILRIATREFKFYEFLLGYEYTSEFMIRNDYYIGEDLEDTFELTQNLYFCSYSGSERLAFSYLEAYKKYSEGVSESFLTRFEESVKEFSYGDVDPFGETLIDMFREMVLN